MTDTGHTHNKITFIVGFVYDTCSRKLCPSPTEHKKAFILEVIYQTLAQVFDHVSKHQERKLKNEAQPSFLTKVRGVKKHDQTLVRVFVTTSQTNMYFRRKRRRKFG